MCMCLFARQLGLLARCVRKGCARSQCDILGHAGADQSRCSVEAMIAITVVCISKMKAIYSRSMDDIVYRLSKRYGICLRVYTDPPSTGRENVGVVTVRVAP